MAIRPYGVVLVAAAAWAAVTAAEPAPGVLVPRPPVRRASVERVARIDRVMSSSQNRRIDVNSINMFVTNYGTFANDIENQGNSGLFFPKGTVKTSVYQSGIWLAGKVNGEIRAAIAEYSQEFQPGAMIGAVPDDPNKEDYTVYKVARYGGSPSDTAHLERDAGAIARDRTLDPLIHHSWSEYMVGAAPYGAPVRAYRFPNPAGGDSITVMGPDVRGDQMLWAVYNDANPETHINRGGRTAPLGVEVQQTTFGFDRQGALGNTVFLEFKVINKGGNQIDSMYIQMWSDPDLGGAGDDLVGSDTTLSLGYVYNATSQDQQYGSRPPAVGYDFFQGPSVGDSTLPLTAFIYYINGTDPQNATQTYNYMQGFQANGSPFLDPQGNPTKFYASGDPTAVPPTGYLDTNPSDRRFMLISGPFSMAPGDTQVIVGAIIIAQGGSRLTSIRGLKFFDIKAQKAFDLGFNLPPPPPQPKVTYSTDFDRVNLFWDSGSRFNYIPPTACDPPPGLCSTWQFEGYNVYQGASISGPWTRIATFDIPNAIADVRDTVFDENTGLIINDTPVAFGSNNGIQYSFSTDQDVIRGGKLKQGQTYYFAVTAYSVNLNPPRGLEKVQENSFQPIAVVIQRAPSGTDVGSARVLEAVNRGRPTGGTTDHVIVEVVDPIAITGHTYCVSFTPLGGDSTMWTLRDVTTGEVLIANQRARTDTPDYASVHGMNVLLRGHQGRGPLNDVYYVPFRANMPFHGVHAGLTYFEDSFGYAWDFLAGIDPEVSPEVFPQVELRYGASQKAYRYFRDETSSGGSPSTGRGYTYQGFHDIPWQAWDVTNNRQLEIGFVERRITDASGNPAASQPATQDATWSPDGSELGGREYLQISLRQYTGSPAAELAQDAAIAGADTLWLYGAWLYRTANPVAGDKFVMLVGDVPATAADTLCFATTAAASNQVDLQRASLERIRVVPNPYYSRSSYELSGFNRVLKFTNLPEAATIRIYNLAGQLIRTLRKTDATSSILEWNLENENRLPVASGIYVYHVEVPNAGSTVGRVVLFIERERLQNF